MNKTTVKKVICDEEERYLTMYFLYAIQHKTEFEIARIHECSVKDVKNAIDWVLENQMKVPSEKLISIILTAIKDRMSHNHSLYATEIEMEKGKDKAHIVALSKEMREDEKWYIQLSGLANPENGDISEHDRNTVALAVAMAKGMLKE